MTGNGAVPLSTVAGAVRIPVRVMPRAPRTVVGGVRDGRLLIRVTSPPVDRAANDAAVAALADILGVAARALTIASGTTTRNKAIDVQGLTLGEVDARLQSRYGIR